MIHKTQAELHQMTYDQRQAYYTEKEFDSQQRQKEINKRLAPDLSADERELAIVRENLERHKKRGVKDSPFTKKERQLVEKIEHDRQLASRLAEPDNVVFVEFAGEKLAKRGDAGATPAELDRLNLQFEVWHKDPSSRQSDAMIADGQHARVDGLTSLAVLGAVFGTWIGFPILDPIIGVVIAIAIIGITWNATKSVWYRLMDAVAPGIITRMEHFTSEVDGVIEVSSLQA